LGIPAREDDVHHGWMIDENAIRSRYEAMRSGLDARARRLVAAVEARTAGYGGVSAVARAMGIARCTIDRGSKGLTARDLSQRRVRRAGGGRPRLTRTDTTLLEDLRRRRQADVVWHFHVKVWICPTVNVGSHHSSDGGHYRRGGLDVVKDASIF
jgi:hypothetical protein